MLPRNSRLMFFALLIALLVVAPVWAVSGPDLTTAISHVGNTGPSNVNYTTSGTGTVTVDCHQ